MKTWIAVLMFTAVGGTKVFAQLPTWEWAKPELSSGIAGTYCVTTDNTGNIYTTGAFTVQITIANTTLTSQGQSDIYIAKYSSSGTPLWAAAAGGLGNDEHGHRIVADNFGNVYVCGQYQDTAWFGNTMISDPGYQSMFIAKYNAIGDLVWVQSSKGGGSYNGETIYDLALDKQGNILMSVYIDSSILIGNLQLYATPPSAGLFFIIKMDSSGHGIWGKRIASVVESVKTDSMGNIYLSGAMGTTLQIDTVMINGVSTGTLQRNIFVAKLDSSGHGIWGRAIGGYSNVSSTGIRPDLGKAFSKVDAAGNVSVSSIAEKCKIKFPNQPLKGNEDGNWIIAKYSTDGVLQWGRVADWYSGTYTHNNLAVDRDGNTYITSPINAPAIFGQDTIKQSDLLGSYDILVAKYETNGNVAWATVNGGPNADGVTAITADASGHGIIISGGTSSNPCNLGNIAYTPNGGNGFLAKISTPSLGIKTNPLAKDNIFLHPNPSTGTFTVRFENANYKAVKITDQLGKTVDQQPLAAGLKEASINLQTLPAGVYYAQFIGNAGAVTKKLVVQH